MLRQAAAAIICAFTLFPTTQASARQWVVLNDSPWVAVDVDSIKGQGNTRTFWSEIVYERENASDTSYIPVIRNKYQMLKTLNYIDCSKNKLGVLRMVGYDSRGDVVDDFDLSHLTVPPNLQSTIPDSIGETKLLYVCGLRTTNGGKKYNTAVSAKKPKPSTTANSNRSFPQKTCGDPFKGNGVYYPVFIDGGNVNKIRDTLCNDAFATFRSEQGVKSVQVASFHSYQRAVAFAKQIRGTVGEATRYENGRVIN